MVISAELTAGVFYLDEWYENKRKNISGGR